MKRNDFMNKANDSKLKHFDVSRKASISRRHRKACWVDLPIDGDFLGWSVMLTKDINTKLWFGTIYLKCRSESIYISKTEIGKPRLKGALKSAFTKLRKINAHIKLPDKAFKL
jgi:hypothetical protein